MARLTAHANNTQSGMLNEDKFPVRTSPNVITPIDFWASFELFDKASMSIVITWRRRNNVFTFGDAFLKTVRRTPMTKKPKTSPSRGPRKSGRITKAKPLVDMACGPFVINVAPSSPPIRACVEEDGMPRHQENRLQPTAAIMAITMVLIVIAEVFTNPVVIERATAEPNMNGAIKSAIATKNKANSGWMARDAITPARMLDESR